MKRFLAATACIVMLVAAVTVAEAKIRGGTFAGATTKKNPVSLKVNTRGRVFDFAYARVKMKCTDGDTYRTPADGPGADSGRKTYRIGSSRRFKIDISPDRNGWGFTATGRFNSKGTAAMGTLSVSTRFDIRNYRDPDGPVRCESGKLNYTVTRR